MLNKKNWTDGRVSQAVRIGLGHGGRPNCIFGTLFLLCFLFSFVAVSYHIPSLTLSEPKGLLSCLFSSLV